MILFADSDTVEVAKLLFGFLGFAMTTVVGYLMWRMNKQQEARAVIQDTRDNAKFDKLNSISQDLKVVHQTTNGMSERLEAAADQAGFRRGGDEARADEVKREEGKR
jgi:hypothetical protein